jgi:hypothetical protein
MPPLLNDPVIVAPVFLVCGLELVIETHKSGVGSLCQTARADCHHRLPLCFTVFLIFYSIYIMEARNRKAGYVKPRNNPV